VQREESLLVGDGPGDSGLPNQQMCQLTGQQWHSNKPLTATQGYSTNTVARRTAQAASSYSLKLSKPKRKCNLSQQSLVVAGFKSTCPSAAHPGVADQQVMSQANNVMMRCNTLTPDGHTLAPPTHSHAKSHQLTAHADVQPLQAEKTPTVCMLLCEHLVNQPWGNCSLSEPCQYP
jgi:hypothetical protein